MGHVERERPPSSMPLDVGVCKAHPSLHRGAVNQHGFTYLLLLFAMALGSIALATLGEQEQTRQRRDKEAELRFRGQAIAAALARYADRTPAGHLPLPQALNELLEDRRFPKPQRHLRRLYADPFTGLPDWELVWGDAARVSADGAAGGPPAIGRGIVGVRSRCERRLLATAGLKADATAHDQVFLARAAHAAVAE